jgi:hypothetical protein
MIKLLEEAIAGLERLPPSEQELAAELLLPLRIQKRANTGSATRRSPKLN